MGFTKDGYKARHFPGTFRRLRGSVARGSVQHFPDLASKSFPGHLSTFGSVSVDVSRGKTTTLRFDVVPSSSSTTTRLESRNHHQYNEFWPCVNLSSTREILEETVPEPQFPHHHRILHHLVSVLYPRFSCRCGNLSPLTVFARPGVLPAKSWNQNRKWPLNRGNYHSDKTSGGVKCPKRGSVILSSLSIGNEQKNILLKDTCTC